RIHEAQARPPAQTTTTERVIAEVYNAGQIREAIPPPLVETSTTEHVTTEVYNAGCGAQLSVSDLCKTHNQRACLSENFQQIHVAQPPPKVESTTTEHVTTEVYNVGTYYEAVPPKPEVRQTATTTSKAETLFTAVLSNKVQQAPRKTPDRHVATSTSEVVEREHAATIRRTPVPETHKATVSSASYVENVATIRQSPAREIHKTTVTPGASVENVMAIRQSAVPEVHRTSMTRGSSVERAAAIRQTDKPEKGLASVTAPAPLENVGQINLPTSQPDKQVFTKSMTPIDRIDDIVVPERRPQTIAEVTQTVTDEARIHHMEQHFTPTQVTTTERFVQGGVGVLHDETIRKEERIVDAVEEESTVERSKRILLEQLEREEKELVERIPKAVKQVTQTTTAEGWVQHVHDDMAQPHAVQTTKRYEKQVVEGVQAHTMAAASGARTVATTKTTEDEEATKKFTQSRIPQLSKRVTTTTSADGFVQHEHDEMAQPKQITTTTRKGDEDARWKVKREAKRRAVNVLRCSY
ncbi:unnamed protein product, partial [Heligmosomoides polygyrus]